MSDMEIYRQLTGRIPKSQFEGSRVTSSVSKLPEGRLMNFSVPSLSSHSRNLSDLTYNRRFLPGGTKMTRPESQLIVKRNDSGFSIDTTRIAIVEIAAPVFRFLRW